MKLNRPKHAFQTSCLPQRPSVWPWCPSATAHILNKRYRFSFTSSIARELPSSYPSILWGPRSFKILNLPGYWVSRIFDQLDRPKWVETTRSQDTSSSESIHSRDGNCVVQMTRTEDTRPLRASAMFSVTDAEPGFLLEFPKFLLRHR